MPAIGHDEAKAFLDAITSDDVVAVIHDTDLDGFSSGVLYYDFVRVKAGKTRHIAVDYADPEFNNLDVSDCNKIVVTDIGANRISGGLEKIKDKQVLFVDHHQKGGFVVPESIFEYSTLSQGYIPCARTALELTEVKEWLGIAGTISDAAYRYKENVPLIDSFLDKVGLSLDEYQKRVINHLSNTIIYFEGKYDECFEILASLDSFEEVEGKLKEFSDPIEDEIALWVKRFEEEHVRIGSVIFFYMEPRYSIKRVLATMYCNKFFDDVLVFASPTRDGRITISTRNQSQAFDMPKLLKACAGDFAISHGGHKAAAGASFYAKDLEKFKENLSRYTLEPIE